MNAYVSFMNAIAANKELKHSTQACNNPFVRSVIKSCPLLVFLLVSSVDQK